MKNIFSFKIYAAAFHVRQMIRFYLYCEKLKQTMYIYGKRKVDQIHQLPELLSILIDNLSHDEECLVVVEGSHAGQMKKILAGIRRRIDAGTAAVRPAY
ncbi:hypothetical protein [Sporolactobacillus vineae]|uniref:hypothetical protein n=1 Tax=Sporolactobacillus vineae TaxID=444463 RepID=UPI00028934CD|nr:hypothetical protein [Sporolactobacillus vineae]